MPTDPQSNADPSLSLALVSRAQQGDSDAYHQLYARYYDRVRRIVSMRMGERLRAVADVEDLVQDTFVAAVQAFPRFEARDAGSFVHWLSKLAENQIRAAVDHARAERRDPARERILGDLRRAVETGTLTVEVAANTTLPPERAARAEERAIVEETIARLEPAQREAILLRDWEGLPWADVARELGKPTEDAARMAYQRAMVELLGRLSKRLPRG